MKREKEKNKKSRIKKVVIVLTSIVVIILAAGFISQCLVKTPKIVDDNGDEIKGSISELIKIDVNGHNEWLSIRGHDKEAPILLFLAGGPGGTQMAAVRYELAELEKHFVVVNWEQPGSGKSYFSMKRSDITVDTYIDDGIYVTKYLRERFNKDKIYMIGESWGSALGIFMADKKPEYYAGFIGTGQMVDFEETEKKDYYKAIEILEEKNQEKKIKKLKKQGEPVYNSGNIAWKSAKYLGVLTDEMTKNPDIDDAGYNTTRDMFASEYGLFDSVYFFLGIMNTFNAVYPQLYDIDLRESYAKLQVPVYFFEGKYDINAPIDIAEEYYNMLECPKKELVWFEHSGHNPWINESDKFVKETVRVFLDK